LAALTRGVEDPDTIVEIFFDLVEGCRPSPGLIEFLLALYPLMPDACVDQLSNGIKVVLTCHEDRARYRVISSLLDTVESSPPEIWVDLFLEAEWLPMLEKIAVCRSDPPLIETDITLIACLVRNDVAVPVDQLAENILFGKGLLLRYTAETLDLLCAVLEFVAPLPDEFLPERAIALIASIAADADRTFSERETAVRALVIWTIHQTAAHLSTINVMEIAAPITALLDSLEEPLPHAGWALCRLAEACGLDLQTFLTRFPCNVELLCHLSTQDAL
jgi:hypothetical protein